MINNDKLLHFIQQEMMFIQIEMKEHMLDNLMHTFDHGFTAGKSEAYLRMAQFLRENND